MWEQEQTRRGHGGVRYHATTPKWRGWWTGGGCPPQTQTKEAQSTRRRDRGATGPGGNTPATQVLARLGPTEMASPASTETLRASLRRPMTTDRLGTRTPPKKSPQSPIEPMVLFAPGSISS